MKKLVFFALVLLGASAVIGIAGRGNVVTHHDRNGVPSEILTSAGSCRHHLTAHPGDTVRGVSAESSDPNACN